MWTNGLPYCSCALRYVRHFKGPTLWSPHDLNNYSILQSSGQENVIRRAMLSVSHLTLARWICVCSPAVVVLSYLFVRDCIFVSLLCLYHFFNVNFYVENIYLYYIYLRTVPLLDHVATVGRCTTHAFKVMDLDTKPEKKQPFMECKSTFLVLIQKSTKHTWAIKASDQPCLVTPLTSFIMYVLLHNFGSQSTWSSCQVA